jgi:hypothetical protein
MDSDRSKPERLLLLLSNLGFIRLLKITKQFKTYLVLFFVSEDCMIDDSAFACLRLPIVSKTKG